MTEETRGYLEYCKRNHIEPILLDSDQGNGSTEVQEDTEYQAYCTRNGITPVKEGAEFKNRDANQYRTVGKLLSREDLDLLGISKHVTRDLGKIKNERGV